MPETDLSGIHPRSDRLAVSVIHCQPELVEEWIPAQDTAGMTAMHGIIMRPLIQMTILRAKRAILFVLAVALLISFNGEAWAIKAGAVNVKIYDLDLLDQDGKPLKFKSDAIGDRIVAMTFTYTTCTTICPVLDSIFADLQERLGQRLGKDIGLITLSIDPVTDIPPRLKRHQKRLKAKPGWIFLTGRKPDVDRILKGLDVYSADIASHPPSVFVGDGRRGVWKRLYGFPSPEQILAAMKELEEGRR